MAVPRVNWSDWSFGPGRHPILGVALAGLVTLSTTMVAAVMAVPAWWLLLAGLGVTLAATVTSVWQHAVRPAVAYRLVTWLAATLWSTITLHWSSPWSLGALVWLAALTVIGGVVGWGLARADSKLVRRAAETEKRKAEAAKAAREAVDEASGTDKTGRHWQALTQRVTRIAVAMTEPTEWRNPKTGFTLRGLLPADGTTVGDLKAYEGSLATAAGLPGGCTVEIKGATPGSGQSLRYFEMHVTTVDALGDVYHLPEDTSLRSIGDDLGIGFHSDRSEAAINLRFTCGVLVGQTDSGKSNQLNVITYRAAQCDDVVLCAIDTTGGGRMPRPWLWPWVEGRATRPIFGAVANSDEEAELLTAGLIQVINGRTGAYQRLMREANDDKLPVSPQVPQILLIVDEFGALSEQVKDNIRTITDTGRGAAVRALCCSLEATATYLPMAILNQSRVRIGMRVTDMAQLQYLLDRMWNSRFDPSSLSHRGMGVYTGGTGVQRHKAWRIEPSRIERAAVELAGRRPELDPVSVALWDTVTRQAVSRRTGERVTERITGVWTDRWARTLPRMFPDMDLSGLIGQVASDASDDGGEPSREVVTVAGHGSDNEESSDAVTDPLAAMAATSAEMLDALEAARQAVAEVEAAEAAEAAGPTEPVEARERVRQIVAEHAETGIGPSAVHRQLVAEGHKTVVQTVIQWMRADEDAGWLAQPGGKGTPYVPGPRLVVEQR